MALRIGQGVDYHQLVTGRDLWLGGVLIPHSKGALGHSDADVLLHAICDAMLGALALGDIGTHFPDTDPQYKNIDSKILLTQSNALINKQGYTIVNIDATLVLEAPKIKPYVAQMQQAIATCCNIDIAKISIKATTAETMGFIGRQEGVMAQAVVLLEK